MRKTFIAILILAASCFGQNSINNPASTSGLASSSSNVTPSFVSAATYVSNTNVTSLVVTAPASITNGNCLLAVVAVPNVNTETWTPPAGFTQIGSTLVANANGKIVVGVFGKVAASESGSYTFSWNNTPGVAQTAQAGMLNISGSACVADGAVVSATANAATVTIGTITPVNANSIVIVGAFQSPQANGATIVQPVLPVNDYLGLTNSPFYFGHFLNGSGVTPSFKASVTSLSDPASAVSNDIVGFAVALAPSATSSTTAFVANSVNAAQTVNTANNTGTGYVAGAFQSGKFFAVPFSTSCAVSVQNPSNGYNFITSAGTFEMGICYSSASNLTLDAGGHAVFVSTFGGSRGGADFLASSGRIDTVSFDASQDLPVVQTPTSSNELVIGCKSVAPATNPTCATATQSSNMYLNVRTGLTEHFQVNDADVATITSAGLSSTAYLSATNCSSSAAPAVCGSAPAGSFVIAAAGTSVTVNTTAVTANSQIFVQEDESLGTKLSVTCNTGILANPPAITARTAATSFAVGITAGLAVNPVCFSYWIVN